MSSLPPTPSELAEALRAMRREAPRCFKLSTGGPVYAIYAGVPEMGTLSDSADLIEQQARELAEMAQERAGLLARVIELSNECLSMRESLGNEMSGVQPASKTPSTLRGMLARPGQEPVPIERMRIGAAQPASGLPGFGKIPAGKFGFGDSVYKIKGADWRGSICGWYSTSLTPEGYAVESAAHPGSVQIYPASVLDPAESSTPPANAPPAYHRSGPSLQAGGQFQRDLQEFVYRVAAVIPFEHAQWARERGEALIAALAAQPAEQRTDGSAS